MTMFLNIIQGGAVTSIGLSANQTCAAIRAGISGFRDAYALPPPDEAVVGAPVPARSRLKRTPTEWLTNLAALAISECIRGHMAMNRTALVISLPERYRNHPALTGISTDHLLHLIQQRLSFQFHGSPIVLQDGHAGPLHGLALARRLLATEEIEYCVVGGVDSLLNHSDISRLRSTYRIYSPDNAQGLIPGEGSAFVLVSTGKSKQPSLSRLLGIGISTEKDTVLGNRYSQGRGLQEALKIAVREAEVEESTIALRVSDMNGERYRAWESLLAECRFYRTWRTRLVPWYFSTSVGDIGAAAGALAVVIAAMGMAKGYAPGPHAMCETSSDEGLRAACVLAPIQDAHKL